MIHRLTHLMMEVFDTRNDLDYDNIEEVFTSKTCSVTTISGFEKIMDLA